MTKHEVQAAVETYIQKPPVKLALGLRGDAELTLSPLGHGEYNLNFLLKATPTKAIREKQVPNNKLRWVVRLAMGSQLHLDQQVTYEYQALKALQPSGRTPLPLYLDDSKKDLPYGLMIESFLPGRPLDYQKDLRIAAHILADIHSLPLTEDTKALLCPPAPLLAIFQECQTMARFYFDWPRADPAVSKRLDRMFSLMASRNLEEAWTGPRAIINTELNNRNFLIGEGGDGSEEDQEPRPFPVNREKKIALKPSSFLVDWEKPLVAEPAQDLAHFLVPTTSFWKSDHCITPEEREFFVQEYEQACLVRKQANQAAGKVGEAGETRKAREAGEARATREAGGAGKAGEKAGKGEESREVGKAGNSPASLRSRLDLYYPLTCLRGVSWCAMALREYEEPGRALKDPFTYKRIKQFLDPAFMDDLMARDMKEGIFLG